MNNEENLQDVRMDSDVSDSEDSKKNYVGMVRGFVFETGKTILTAFLIAGFINVFITRPNQVKGPSMEPSIHENDLILTNQIKYLLNFTSVASSLNLEFERGDIIIFQLPGLDPYIKRIVGLPGEEVMVKGGYIYINGRRLHEEYLPEGTMTQAFDFLREGESKIVPEGHYAVMGDNRNNSTDSRRMGVGFIKKQYIIGPAALRILPLQDFGRFDMTTYFE